MAAVCTVWIGSSATGSGGMALAGSGTSGASTGSGASSSAFSIAGNTGGLFPGLTVNMTLTVNNREHFAIDVTSITSMVSNGSSLCPAANVSVGAFSGNMVVAAGGTATTAVPVTMAYSAPDPCQGLTFPFAYRGQAVKA